jgi:hypothetical protein
VKNIREIEFRSSRVSIDLIDLIEDYLKERRRRLEEFR